MQRHDLRIVECNEVKPDQHTTPLRAELDAANKRIAELEAENGRLLSRNKAAQRAANGLVTAIDLKLGYETMSAQVQTLIGRLTGELPPAA